MRREVLFVHTCSICLFSQRNVISGPSSGYRFIEHSMILLITGVLITILVVGVLCLSLFCYAILCVHSSFTIILKRKRKLVAMLLSSYRCIVTINVMRLFPTLPWVGLQNVIVVFPDHTHLLFVYMGQLVRFWDVS